METTPTAQVKNALKRIEDQEGELGKITFEEFCELHRVYPSLMYPAFRLQTKMQMKFIGVEFWQRKKSVMAEAREMLKNERVKADEKIKKGLYSLHYLHGLTHLRIIYSLVSILLIIERLERARHKKEKLRREVLGLQPETKIERFFRDAKYKILVRTGIEEIADT